MEKSISYDNIYTKKFKVKLSPPSTKLIVKGGENINQ